MGKVCDPRRLMLEALMSDLDRRYSYNEVMLMAELQDVPALVADKLLRNVCRWRWVKAMRPMRGCQFEQMLFQRFTKHKEVTREGKVAVAGRKRTKHK